MRKYKYHILYIVVITILFSLITINNSSNTSALSYQGSAEIKFTFNPTLSISVSAADLVIDNLTPGTTSDSNIINVSVATNASHGYTLSATVGDSLHNNTNLTHTNVNNTFSSIAINSSLSSLTTNNTWGYSYKLSNNTTWNNYSGLSNETSKTLVSTDNQLAKPIDFKIAAKAAETQPSGTYTNTVNFIAISKPIPKTIEDIVYMQTFGELLPTDLQSVKDSMEEEHTYILKDARDEQDYTIAKLADGHCWMTQNLNLLGGIALSSIDTDFSSNYTLPTTGGWTVEDGKLVLPTSAAKNAGDNSLTDSTQFSNNNYAYVFNSGNTADCGASGQNTPCYSYYSWDVATLGSGRNIATENTDAPYSVCPKGWRLPTSGNSSNNGWKRGNFYTLAADYGADLESNYNDSSSATSGNFYNNAGPGTTPNFLLTAYYDKGSFYNGGSYGYYWSSTSYGNGNVARSLTLSPSYVNSAGSGSRRWGFAIRCLSR